MGINSHKKSRMKIVSNWFKSLAVVAVAACAAIGTVKEARGDTVAFSWEGKESIEIYVPPPDLGNSNLCPEFLEPEIRAIADRVGGNWGIMITSLNDGATLYSYNPDRLLIPASNVKILTAAAALQRLDPSTSIRSTSLRKWVEVTLLRSNNNYADVLLSYLGGSTAARQTLSELGVNPGGFRMVDGSGLSRQNVATPRAIIQTLDAMKFARGRDIFFDSLPVAGVSGTLRNRLKQTPAQKMVFAKTGTLRGVRALSGYMEHPEYDTLIFSIIVNQPSKAGYTLVKGIDDIVLAMSNLSRCQ